MYYFPQVFFVHYYLSWQNRTKAATISKVVGKPVNSSTYTVKMNENNTATVSNNDNYTVAFKDIIPSKKALRLRESIYIIHRDIFYSLTCYITS